MRSEKEMLDLIIKTAREDEHIRAVMMNGSRANPNAPRDFFQDFDIVYIIGDISPYKRNLEWIKRFGEMMILQLPDDMSGSPQKTVESYCYLMQFLDGNRIDLTLYPVASLNLKKKDSQTIILLDKDNLLLGYPPPGESDYLPEPPTSKEFHDCTNEFWWVSPYVAKGLWRGEFTYARQMMEYMRDELMKMLTWYVGMKSGFQVNPGKYGKYFEKYLESDLWERLLDTYAAGSYEQSWQALFEMGELFRNTALLVAEHFGYDYPQGDDERVSAHLRHVMDLPRDAEEMY